MVFIKMRTFGIRGVNIMDNDIKLLAEALHNEVDFIKERIKKLELLIGKVIEKAAENKEIEIVKEISHLSYGEKDYVEL